MAWLSGWSHRYAVTLDNSLSPNAATGFQSHIALSAANFDFTKAKADGSDIRITDADQVTLLPFYLESYDGTSSGSIWVKKSLSATTVGTAYLYVGNSGASSVSSYDNTFGKFAADANTLCLIHFDDGSGSSPVDATGTYTPSVVSGPPTWSGSDGGMWGGTNKQFATGSYVTLNGSSQYVSVPGLLDTWPAQGTIEGWWKSPPSYSGNPRIFSKWNAAPGSNGGIDLAWDSGGYGPAGALYFGIDNVNGYMERPSQTIVAANTWYYIAVTWTGGEYSLYINGQKDADVNNNGLQPATGSANPFYLGAYPGGITLSACSFDEWRVSNVCRLPEEIRANYLRRAYMKGMEESGRWGMCTRADSLSPSNTEGAIVIEPSVIADSAVPGYRMTYTGSGLDVATSPDGMTWTRQGSTGVTGNGSCLIKSGSTYYVYWLNGYAGASMYYSSSTNGVTFTGSTVVIANGAQAWLSGVSNMCVVYDAANSRYIMGLSNFDLSGKTCRTGFATAATLPNSWTLWSGNPATGLQFGSGLYSPRSLNFDANGDLHMWGHVSHDNNLIPTEIYHYKLTAANVAANNFNSWDKLTGSPVFPLAGETFSGGAADQTADPVLVDMGTQVVMYYDFDRNTAGAGQQGTIGQVVFPGSMANLLTDRPAISLGSIQNLPSFSPAWAVFTQPLGVGIY